MEDAKILELYRQRSEQALEETRHKYNRYCHYIAFQILENDADAEEIVGDTYLKVWNTIPPNCPKSLKAYVGMLARQLSLDAWRANNAQKRSGQVALVLDELSECISDGRQDLGESLALRDALNRFVRNLPERTRKIFIRRYWYASSIAEIAQDFHMKESAVTVLMLRIRKKLKVFLEKEGFIL